MTAVSSSSGRQLLAEVDHPHWCTYWLTAIQRSPAVQHLHWASWPHSVTPPQGLPLSTAAPGKWQARVWLMPATEGGSALRVMVVGGGLRADLLLGAGLLVDDALAFFAGGGGGRLRKLAALPAGGGGLRGAGDEVVHLLVPLAGGGPRLLPGGLLLMILVTDVGGAVRPAGLVLLNVDALDHAWWRGALEAALDRDWRGPELVADGVIDLRHGGAHAFEAACLCAVCI